jgi:hypothetical protein
MRFTCSEMTEAEVRASAEWRSSVLESANPAKSSMLLGSAWGKN